MDINQIEKLAQIIESNNIREFEVEEKGFKLRIKRGGDDMPVVAAPAPVAIPAAPAPVAAAPAAAAAEPAAPVEEAGIEIIKSPMVGTFYSAPSPESDAFVSVGTQVTADTIVCIVEAMKVMNEIQAELSGTVTEVLVENGAAIEYGQPLFKVKSS